MSKKVFETDSDLELDSEPEVASDAEVEETFNEETKRIEETKPKRKPKAKGKAKLLEPEDDNTKVIKTDELGEPKKQRKKRPPLTEERKAQLLANLEKGRLKALENRKKKAQVKKIIKKKKEEEMDTLIQEDLAAKKSQASEKNKLREDLDEMKLMMKKLMEENSQLQANQAKSVPKPTLSPVNEEPPTKEAPKPVAQVVPVAPVRPKHVSKGIQSRWAKYKK